jgi:hypothetical protein
VALDPIAVALKFGFLAVLYLFLLWIARSALKDLRRAADPRGIGPGAAALAAPPGADATGLYSATGGARPDLDQLDPRLVVERAPGTPRGWSTRWARARCSAGASRPRSASRTRSPPHGTRASSAGRRGRARGHGLDERHLPQRGAAQRPAAAAPGRRVRIGDSSSRTWSADDAARRRSHPRLRHGPSSQDERGPLVRARAAVRGRDGMGGRPAGEVASQIAIDVPRGGPARRPGPRPRSACARWSSRPTRASTTPRARRPSAPGWARR